MGLRPAKCYRDSSKMRAFTRLAMKVPDKNYIGTAPGVRTRQFNMGNPIKNFTRIMDLQIGETMQIRDNAMEAVRQAINRYMQKHLGKEGYFMKIRVYPHQVLRENKQAQGAGADRIQKGMSHPYGRPIGRAIRVREGQIIISLLCDPEKIELDKTGLKRAGPKLGAVVHIKIGTDVERIGTRPKTVKEEAAPTIEKTEAKECEAAATGKEGEKGKEAPTGKDAKKPETAGGKKDTGGKKDAGAKKEEPKKDAKGKK